MAQKNFEEFQELVEHFETEMSLSIRPKRADFHHST